MKMLLLPNTVTKEIVTKENPGMRKVRHDIAEKKFYVLI